jgi:hypothetical protein
VNIQPPALVPSDEPEPQDTMKHLFYALVLPLLLTAGLAERADAQRCYGGTRTFIGGYTHCGCPIYKQRYVAYHDHCGHPVYRVRLLPIRHKCSHRPHYYHHGGYGCGVTKRATHGRHTVVRGSPGPRISISPGRGISIRSGRCR